MKNYLLFSSLLFLVACQEQSPKSYDFSHALLPTESHAVLEDEQYYTWGASPIKGEDGLYHLYYSRWKKDKGFLAWVTHSEIAHATSEHATGPYTFHDLALGATDAARWDGLNLHNPTIKKFGDKYYLYYTGNTGDGVATYTGYNISHRNGQRIGVAVASSPYGPWQTQDTPLIDVSADSTAHDALMVANPSVTQMKDGKYLMIYKAVAKKKPMPLGGPVCHLYAIADRPDGPFKKYHVPIFTAKNSSFPAEDPYIWLQGDTYYAIVKDMHGAFTQQGKSLALFTSQDGIDWRLADHPLVSTLQVEWEHGQKHTYQHLERPQLLFEEGKPSVLFLATDTMPDYKVPGHSFNMHVKLQFD